MNEQGATSTTALCDVVPTSAFARWQMDCGRISLELFLNFAPASLGKLLPRPGHLFQLLTVCRRGRSGQCPAL
jgi:hypothetical protein